MADYTELVKGLREHAERFDYDGWIDTAIWFEQAADAIEELSKLADAIPHVCECCVGCELEKKNGGCDHAFVLSPKRAMQYLIKPRWIPVTERLPEPGVPCICWCKGGTYGQIRWYGLYYLTSHRTWALDDNDCIDNREVTHWMPRPEPPKEGQK